MGGYFNDPGMAQGFANLERAFKPPSARDLYAAAEAQATNDKNARLQQLFMRSQDPATTHEMLDRLGIGAGSFSPNQSYYGVDTGNQVTMRGQDVVANTALRTNAATNATSRLNNTDDNAQRDRGDLVRSGDSRYGTDVGATTSLTNNAADNAEKAREAAATAALGGANNIRDNQVKFITSRFGAQGANTVAPMVPTSVLRALNLPEDAGAPSVGIRTASQGETNLAPDGSVLQGVAPSVTPQQAVGAQVAAVLPKVLAGGQAPAGMDALVRSVLAPQAQSELGKIQSDRDVVAQPGDVPLYNKDMEKTASPTAGGETKTANYRTRDGVLGQAILDPAAGVWRDMNTKQPLPGGSVTFQGNVNAPDVTSLGKPTENDVKNASFAIRGAASNDGINKMLDAGYRPSTVGYEASQGVLADKLPLSVSNWLANKADPGAQEYSGYVQGFLNSVLRPDSGATFGEKELQNYTRTFIPLPYDTPPTLAAKKTARDLVVQVTKAGTRGLAEQIIAKLQASGVPVSPELISHLRIGEDPGDGTTATNPSVPGAPVGASKGPPIPAPAGAVPGDTGAGKSAVTPPAAAPNSSTPAPAPHADGVTGTYKGHKVKIVNGVPVDAVTGQPVE